MKVLKLNNITLSLIDKETKIMQAHEILDIMATTRYNENCDNVGMIIHEESLGEKFFDLKTKFAGELLQKFSNYNMSLVIVGDFKKYTSNSLHDFIRECNRGKQIFFLPSVEDGILKYKSLYS